MQGPKLKVTMVIEIPVMPTESVTLDDEARSTRAQLNKTIGLGVTRIHLQGEVVAVSVEPLGELCLD
jgi:hypothetical protein